MTQICSAFLSSPADLITSQKGSFLPTGKSNKKKYTVNFYNLIFDEM